MNRSYVIFVIIDFCVMIFFSFVACLLKIIFLSFVCANHLRASACPQRGDL